MGFISVIFTLFSHEDSLGLFFCHLGHNKETKSVEFAFVAVSVRVTQYSW